MKKLPPEQLRTRQGRANTITQLVSNHSGEVVELDPRAQDWRLVALNAGPGSARDLWNEFYHKQIWCTPDGLKRSKSHNRSVSFYDTGYSANQTSLRHQHEQARQCTICDPNHSCTIDMLMPNFEEQWNRLQVPCQDADDYMWFRTGKVITLGELFLALGRDYTAASIYAFYRTLRIVVLKRCKDHSHEPGSASAYTGLTNGPLQASTMKRSLCSDRTTKQYIIKEYIEAKGRKTRTDTGRVLGAAVRHMHKILLCDLNPPWVHYQFPQALPGVTVLSRFTRPSFLQWIDDPQGTTRTLFGNVLSGRVQRLMEYMGLQHAGFVARPLCACTKCFETGRFA